MRKEYIQKIVTRHGNKIKVFWWIFAIIVMLIAVKTYVNYSEIVNEIDSVNKNINAVEQEIAYAEKFYSKYLDSDYSMYFLSHKNNVLFDWEYIIKISATPKESDNDSYNDNEKIYRESPQESRKRFIKSKIN